MAGPSRARPTCARARRPSRSARSPRCTTATSRPTPTAATARRSPWAWRPRPRSRSSWAGRPAARAASAARCTSSTSRKGNIGANAIVGAGLPIAVGAARRVQDAGEADASRSRFFGDGATNIGTFHEALNMAAVWKAPVVFIITNNLYGEYSPLRRRRRSTTWPAARTRFGMPGHHRRRPGRRRRARGGQRGARAGRARRRPEPAGDEDLPLSRPLPLRPGQVPARRRARRAGRSATRSSSSARSSRRRAAVGPTTQAPSATETQAEIDAAAERAAEAPVPDPRGDAAVCLR